MCTDAYGISAADVASAVDDTNILNGGRNIGSSKIVFPNGSVDPWHAMGLLESDDADLPVVYIQGLSIFNGIIDV